MSSPASISAIMVERPSEDVERITFMPLMSFISSSIGILTSFSTSSAEAPGNTVVTETNSSLIEGNSSSGSMIADIMPTTRMDTINRLTNTEFLTENSAMCICKF